MDEIRRAIEKIEDGAQTLKTLSSDSPSLMRNADIILTFVYLLKFLTPSVEAERR